MTYEPLHHALQMISKYLIFGGVFEHTNVMPIQSDEQRSSGTIYMSNRNLVGNLTA